MAVVAAAVVVWAAIGGRVPDDRSAAGGVTVVSTGAVPPAGPPKVDHGDSSQPVRAATQEAPAPSEPVILPADLVAVEGLSNRTDPPTTANEGVRATGDAPAQDDGAILRP